jgi:hypothetical protein
LSRTVLAAAAATRGRALEVVFVGTAIAHVSGVVDRGLGGRYCQCKQTGSLFEVTVVLRLDARAFEFGDGFFELPGQHAQFGPARDREPIAVFE